jgi:hypothetical protein
LGANHDNWLPFVIRAAFADRTIVLGGAPIRADSGCGGRSVDTHFIWRQWMRLQPKRAGADTGIYAGFLPPCGFIATAMGLAMMAPAQRHRELIADLAPKGAVLCEAQMMGICRPAAANQTRLFRHEFDVLPVAKAARLRIG